MRFLLTAAAVAWGFAIPYALHAAPTCPAFGSATAGCDLIITVTDSGTTVTTGPSFSLGGGTYDGSDDTLIGILNDSSTPLTSISLSSSTDIFGFDGDGINTYGAPGNASDPSGYGGPNTFFTNINVTDTAGTVNFLAALAANGGETYFSLEDALTPSDITPTPPITSTPEPSTLILFGTGLAGFAGAVRRRFAR